MESFHLEMEKHCQHKPKESPDTQKKLQVAWTSRDDAVLIFRGLNSPPVRANRGSWLAHGDGKFVAYLFHQQADNSMFGL